MNFEFCPNVPILLGKLNTFYSKLDVVDIDGEGLLDIIDQSTFKNIEIHVIFLLWYKSY